MAERKNALCADGLLRPLEAAAFLAISRTKLFELMSDGKLKYVRIDGGDRRIPHRECVRYAAERLVERGQ